MQITHPDQAYHCNQHDYDNIAPLCGMRFRCSHLFPYFFLYFLAALLSRHLHRIARSFPDMLMYS